MQDYEIRELKFEKTQRNFGYDIKCVFQSTDEDHKTKHFGMPIAVMGTLHELIFDLRRVADILEKESSS